MAKKGAKPPRQTGGVAAKVEALVRPAIEGLGLRLWDVRYEKEGGEWYLRVLIDPAPEAGPMDTDTCEAATRAIDPILDEADPIEDSYYLEVGSPGLGRKLTRPEHFTALLNQKIAVTRYRADEAGNKYITGLLRGMEDGIVRLEVDGKEYRLDKKDAGSFKLCDDEDLFG